MRTRFPAFSAATLEWINVAGVEGLNADRFAELLALHIRSDEVIVAVHRKQGDTLARHEVLEYVRQNLGKGEIRVADLDFTSFVVVGANGVAAGWTRGT